MVEISHRAWGLNKPNNNTDGSIPINGVWVSLSLKIGGFNILSFNESVGNHSTMIFDVSTRSLIGEHDHKVVRAACRRPKCKTPSLGRYKDILKNLMNVYRMEEMLDVIIEGIVDDKPIATQKAKTETLDRQVIKGQKHAER